MSNPTFEGFEAANTTPVPDVLFDELLPKLSGPQLKVLLYIIRRTAGFKKSSDGISLSQFTDGIKTRDGKVLDNGCGIKKRSSVSKVLRELIAMGCVESAKAKTDMGDDAVTTYSVRFKGVGAKLALPSDETSTTVVPKQPLPGSAQIGTRGSAQIGTHKKQLTRNSNKQETDLQGVTYDSAIATSSPAQFAFQIEGWERFYYHDYCVHAGDRGINDDFTFIIKPLSDVPQDAECSICYKPVHGPHGYDELPQPDEPYTPKLDYLQEIDAAREQVNEAIEAVDALSEQESPIALPVGAASGYEKREDENEMASVGAHPGVGTLHSTPSHAGSGDVVGLPLQRRQSPVEKPTLPGVGSADRAGKNARSAGTQGSRGAAGASKASTTKTEQEQTPSEVKKPVEMPGPDAKWCTRTCLQMFEAWRGKPLLSKYQLQQASHCAKALSENYTREQVESVREYMIEDDPWWSKKPETVDVCTVAENIHKKLPEMERAKKKVPQSSQKGYTLAVQDPEYNIDDDFYNNAAAWAAFDKPKEGSNV